MTIHLELNQKTFHNKQKTDNIKYNLK